MYQKYKEVWLLIIAFFLTSVLGTGVTGYREYLIKNRVVQQNNLTSSREKGEQVMEQVSKTISERHYLSLRYIDAIRGKVELGKETEDYQKTREQYIEALYNWNNELNLMRVKI